MCIRDRYLHQVFFRFPSDSLAFFARISYFIFFGILRNSIKQWVHSRLLDMRLVIATRLVGYLPSHMQQARMESLLNKIFCFHPPTIKVMISRPILNYFSARTRDKLRRILNMLSQLERRKGNRFSNFLLKVMHKARFYCGLTLNTQEARRLQFFEFQTLEKLTQRVSRKQWISLYTFILKNWKFECL